MMDNGGFAFPCNREDGMTLRDWFAGQALAGLMTAKARYYLDAGNGASPARDAYKLADAMLAARREEGC